MIEKAGIEFNMHNLGLSFKVSKTWHAKPVVGVLLWPHIHIDEIIHRAMPLDTTSRGRHEDLSHSNMTSLDQWYFLKFSSLVTSIIWGIIIMYLINVTVAFYYKFPPQTSRELKVSQQFYFLSYAFSPGFATLKFLCTLSLSLWKAAALAWDWCSASMALSRLRSQVRTGLL